MSAPRAPKSSGCSGFYTTRVLGAGGCVCQRRVLGEAAAAQGLPPPGLCELAGVCVSAACYEKQRLLKVCHRQGSVSWRVCVLAPRAPKSSGCSRFYTARALGAGGCVCQRRVPRKAAAAQGFTPSWLGELASVCVSTTCSEKQRLLKVCHRHGSVSWWVCVLAPRAPKSSGCSGFHTVRALGAGGCVCQRHLLRKNSGY